MPPFPIHRPSFLFLVFSLHISSHFFKHLFPCIPIVSHRVVVLYPLLGKVNGTCCPVHVTLVDRENEDIEREDINLKMHAEISGMDRTVHRVTSTHFFSPALQPSCGVPLIHKLAVEKGIQKMNFSPRFPVLEPTAHQIAVRVHHLIIQPSTRLEPPEASSFHFRDIEGGFEFGISEVRVNFRFLLRRETGWNRWFEGLFFGELECFEVLKDGDEFKTGSIRWVRLVVRFMSLDARFGCLFLSFNASFSFLFRFINLLL